MTENEIQKLILQIKHELANNIMPFWMKHSIDDSNGGFIGEMSNDLKIVSDAPRGVILNARLLWTFSAWYRFTGDAQWLKMATRAFDYLMNHFQDREFGGVFWNVDTNGKPLDECKKIYGQAFMVYALAEFYRSTNHAEALQAAKQTFGLIEKYALDRINGGYFEVFNRDWSISEDQRLGDEDMNEKKSMNNHLHLLEAYTNLYRVWKDPAAEEALGSVIRLFMDRIVDSEKKHLLLFFDENWNCKSKAVSFGHDIEASWLLYEAAQVLGDARLLDAARKTSISMAEAIYGEALNGDSGRGGLYYEKDSSGKLHRFREHWCQAEGVVGFINAWQLTGDINYLKAAFGIWDFIRDHQIDKVHGDWFWRIDENDEPVDTLPKVSAWKDPYHNGRFCIETIERLTKMLNTDVSPMDGTRTA